MSTRAKALGAVVSVVSIAAVVIWALGQDAPTFPTSREDLSWLAAAIVGYFGACAIRAERWLLLLRQDGARPTRLDAYALTAVGFLGNNVLPARAGDAMRVVLLAPRAQTDKRSVIGTLVAERLLDVAVLLGLFAVVAFGLARDLDRPSGGRFLFIALVGVALVVVAVVAGVVLHRRGTLQRALEFIKPMARSTAALRGRHGAEALAMTAAVWAVEIGVWWATAEAAGLSLSALEACYVVSLAAVFVLIPAGPGYAGTLDAAIIFGTRAIGRSSQLALSYVLLLRFVLLIPITLAGLVALIGRYGGLRMARGATTT